MKNTYQASSASWFALNYWALASKQRERLAELFGCHTTATESMYHHWNLQQKTPTQLAFLPPWFCHPGNVFDIASNLTYTPIGEGEVVPVQDMVMDYTCFERSAFYDWNGEIHVRGVKKTNVDENGFQVVWARAPEEPDFWCVYLGQHEGDIENVATLNTENQADEFAGLLRTILSLNLPNP